MRYFSFISALFITLSHINLKAESYDLFGIVDDKLVTIDQPTGKLNLYSILNPAPSGTLRCLTFHEEKNCFFSIQNPSSSPMLVRISLDGECNEIGRLKSGSNGIELCEGLSYDTKNKKLYLSASLNGGIDIGDYHCESLLEVNTDDAICTPVYTFKFNDKPDGDNIVFDEGDLYVYDGNPPTENFFYIYRYLQNKGVNPVKIYSSEYIASIDGTVIDDKMYIIESRNLVYLSLSNNDMHFVGKTHESWEYGGKLLGGIAKKASCQRIEFDLPHDTIICDKNPIHLRVETENMNYSWSTGSKSQEIIVNQSGLYWVTVHNECDSHSDSIYVDSFNSPNIDLGPDTIICDDEIIVFDFTENTNNKYLWSDFTFESYKEISSSGVYSVSAVNQCGAAKDTIIVKYLSPPSITIGTDTILCPGDHTLHIRESESVYYWEDGSQDTIFTINRSGKYKVSFENKCGIAETFFNVEILNFDNAFIPNVITPNGDPCNEYFKIDNRLSGSEIFIYNRWGAKVYENYSYQNNWNGLDLPSGVYYYRMNDVCTNQYNGWIQILY